MDALGSGRIAYEERHSLFSPDYDKTDAMREAGLLLRFGLNLDPIALALDPDMELSFEEIRRLDVFLARRCAAEPMAYITGCREFYGREFTVTKDTLIPRPDTETLVDEAIRFLKKKLSGTADRPIKILDFGTGSGCIAVTLLGEIPGAMAVGVDINEAALAIAELNACRLLGINETLSNSLQPNTSFSQNSGKAAELSYDTSRFFPVCCDMTEASCVQYLRNSFGQFDLVISNPPYVTEDEYALLSPAIRCFEPKAALVSAAKDEHGGCCHIAAVIRAASVLLNPGGMVIIEHGYAQGQDVRTMLSDSQWKACETVHDLAGQERCTKAVFVPHAKRLPYDDMGCLPCK